MILMENSRGVIALEPPNNYKVRDALQGRIIFAQPRTAVTLVGSGCDYKMDMQSNLRFNIALG